MCVYVSKMVSFDKGRFLAYGRVFSGTVRSEKVKILGSNYTVGGNIDVYRSRIQSVLVMMGKEA